MGEIERRKDLREHDTKRRARKVYKNARGKIQERQGMTSKEN
jgi:hypothetical protein